MTYRYQQPVTTSMLHRLCSAFIVVLAGLLLVTTVNAQPEPHQQMLDAVKALRQNDLMQLIQGFSTPEEYEKMASEWEVLRTEAVSDEDRAKFNASFGLLLSPNAEDTIMALVEPQLEQMRAQWTSQIPLYEGIAMMGIQGAENITPEDKTQATELVQAIAKWAKENDLMDPQLARQAIRETIDVTKSFGIQTLDDMKSLSMDEMLTRGGNALAGVKRIIAVYGLSIDDMLDSFTAETISADGDTATVKVGMRLFDQPLETETELRLVDGRWISPEAAQSLASMTAGGGPATEVQDMPTVAQAEGSGSSGGSAPPVAGQTAAEVYLRYHEVVQQATSFEQVSPYWASWVSETAATQDEAVRMAKLEELRGSTSNVQIVGETWTDDHIVLRVIGEDINAQPLDGNVVLIMQEQQWRIDDISWQPRLVATAMAEPDMLVITVPESMALTMAGDAATGPDMAEPAMAEPEMAEMETANTETPDAVDQPMDMEPESEQQQSTMSAVEEVASAAGAGAVPAGEDGSAQLETPEITEDPMTEQPTESEPADVAAMTPQPEVGGKTALQESLDRNPFLRHYNIRITAVELADGFLTAEMSEGPESLLQQIRSGYDALEGDLDVLTGARDKQAALAVRKSIDVMKDKYGLVAVLLLATPGSEEEQMPTTETTQTASVETGMTTMSASEAAPPEETMQPEEAEQSMESVEPDAGQAEAGQQAKLEEETKHQERRERIRNIQTRLNELGYDAGVADGKAGQGTRGAIKEYQTASGLPADGQPSEALLTHINSGAAVPNPAVEPEPTVTEAEEVEEPEEEGKLKKLFGNIFKKKDSNQSGKN